MSKGNISKSQRKKNIAEVQRKKLQRPTAIIESIRRAKTEATTRSHIEVNLNDKTPHTNVPNPNSEDTVMWRETQEYRIRNLNDEILSDKTRRTSKRLESKTDFTQHTCRVLRLQNPMLVNYNCNQLWVDQTLVNEGLTTKYIIYVIAVPIHCDSQYPNRPNVLVRSNY